MKTFDELMFELAERKAVGLAQRRKMAIRMRKMMKNPAVQAKIARTKKRLAGNDKIRKRALKTAKQIIIQKYAGMDKAKYMSLPIQQRLELDNRIVSKKQKAIQKIAKKLMVKLKKAELERLKQARSGGSDK